MNNFEKSNQIDDIKSKLIIFKDHLQKTTVELDVNVSELMYTTENYINDLNLISNRKINYFDNKSKALANIEDFIHIINVGKTILNSILNDLE